MNFCLQIDKYILLMTLSSCDYKAKKPNFLHIHRLTCMGFDFPRRYQISSLSLIQWQAVFIFAKAFNGTT